MDKLYKLYKDGKEGSKWKDKYKVRFILDEKVIFNVYCVNVTSPFWKVLMFWTFWQKNINQLHTMLFYRMLNGVCKLEWCEVLILIYRSVIDLKLLNQKIRSFWFVKNAMKKIYQTFPLHTILLDTTKILNFGMLVV